MPIVRCPDCFRNIAVSQEDLTRVIECSVCEARFGPLVTGSAAVPTPSPAPAPPANRDEERERSSDRAVRTKKYKPKAKTRIWPIVVGVFVALSASAALLFAIYILIHSEATGGRPATTANEKSPAGTP